MISLRDKEKTVRQNINAAPPIKGQSGSETTTFAIILALSFCHLLNDMMQALLAGIYPILAANYGLSFSQIGMLTFVFMVTASILQPLVGHYTDKNRHPYSLVLGMGLTMAGLLILAFAADYWLLLLGAGTIGLGSSIFHPDSSRIARLASGGRFGLAQSVFQVGGYFGTALGPLAAALIVLQNGQWSVSWFSLAALLGMVIMWFIGRWYKENHARPVRRKAGPEFALPKEKVRFALFILVMLIFSKHVYMVSFQSYYTFYMIEHFSLSIRDSQLLLFVFMAAVALGTLMGGSLGDRFGRRAIIWFSVLGAIPFALALPHVSFEMTVVLSTLIALILSSAFPAIVVYAQELVPGKVGMIAGLFFGLAFGMGGLGAAALGFIADATSIETVYLIASFLPLIGLVAVLLPKVEE